MTQHPTHWLVIANGEPLEKSQLRTLIANKKCLALDGALNQLLKYAIFPDAVIGDFDSIDAQAKQTLPQSIPCMHYPDQNSTDLEKALHYLQTQSANTVTICHATGWRLDHTLYNLRLLKRFHQTFQQLMIVTATEQIYYLKDQQILLTASQKAPMALLAFPQAQISSRGLAYDMQALNLRFGYQESTSNAIIAPKARIDIQGEALLILDPMITTICEHTPSS